MEKLNLAIVVGATLSSSVGAVAGATIAEVGKIGKTVDRLKAKERRIGEFVGLKSGLKKREAGYSAAQAKVNALAREARAAKTQAESLAQGLAKAKAQASSLAMKPRGGGDLDKANAKVQALEKSLESARTAAAQIKLKSNGQASVTAAAKKVDQLTQSLALAQQKANDLKIRARNSAAVDKAKASVKKLTAELKVAESATRKVGERFKRAAATAAGLKTALDQDRVALQRVRGAMQAAGDSTRGLARQKVRLGEALKRTTRLQIQYNKVVAGAKAAKHRRMDLQMQAMDIAMIGTALVSPVVAAAKFEDAMADVRKVVDFKSPAAFKQMGDDIRVLATRKTDPIPMATTALAQITAVAGRAGIEVNELTAFTEDAAKVSIAWGIAAEETAGGMVGLRTIFNLGQTEVMGLADAFNFLDNNMDATAVQILNITNRAGATGRLMGLTGQQVAALGASFLALKSRPQVAATAMNAMFNRLSTADRQSDQFKDALAEIGMTAEDLKEQLKIDPQAGLIDFLEAVKGAEDVQGVLTDLFGLEYSDDIAKLVGGIDTYKEALGRVAQESEYIGSAQKEFEDRSKTTIAQTTIFWERVKNLGTVLGTVLLPGINAVTGGIGEMFNAVAGVAEKFPLVTAVVGGLTVGLLALKVTILAGAYAWTYVSGSIAITKLVLGGLRFAIFAANYHLQALNYTAAITAIRMRALAIGGGIQAFGSVLMGFVGRVIPMVVTGFRVLSVAIMTNPIGFIVGGLAAVAGLIIMNWQKVKGFFMRLWEPIAPIWKKAIKVIFWPLRTLLAPVLKLFSWLFGDDAKKEVTVTHQKGEAKKKERRLNPGPGAGRQEATLTRTSLPGGSKRKSIAMNPNIDVIMANPKALAARPAYGIQTVAQKQLARQREKPDSFKNIKLAVYYDRESREIRPGKAPPPAPPQAAPPAPPVVMNIYGAAGQDEEAIAEKVAQKLAARQSDALYDEVEP